MTMTSFYVEVDRWGRRDKKAEAKVVGLAASPAPMAQQPQGTFVDVLSTRRYFAEDFRSMIYLHHYAFHQQGNLNYHQPENYKVHRVSILKRYLWIQHETLIFEIHHNPPPLGVAHPPFYIRVDRIADHSNKSLAFDRVTCSHMIPDLPRATTLWSLRVGNNLNDNPIDLLHLAALLCATLRVAPDYRLSGHNCFWHTSATEQIIRERILAGHQGVVITEDPQQQRCCFRRHRCLGLCMGIPTNDEIDDIHALYVQLLGIDGIQVNQAGPKVVIVAD